MRLWLNRFWIQITADRKRFGMLCVVLAVGLLLWSRLIVVTNIPRTAVAGRPVTVAADKGTSPIVTEPAKAAPKHVPIPVELHAAPDRDPFVISQTHFPRPTPSADLPQEAGKSPAEPAEDPLQVEARVIARLGELVSRLKLEAAMGGGSMAVISGKTFRVGDWVGGPETEAVLFRLEEVRHRSVVLNHEGRRFELWMTGPGR